MRTLSRNLFYDYHISKMLKCDTYSHIDMKEGYRLTIYFMTIIFLQSDAHSQMMCTCLTSQLIAKLILYQGLAYYMKKRIRESENQHVNFYN